MSLGMRRAVGAARGEPDAVALGLQWMKPSLLLPAASPWPRTARHRWTSGAPEPLVPKGGSHRKVRIPFTCGNRTASPLHAPPHVTVAPRKSLRLFLISLLSLSLPFKQPFLSCKMGHDRERGRQRDGACAPDGGVCVSMETSGSSQWPRLSTAETCFPPARARAAWCKQSGCWWSFPEFTTPGVF